MCRLAAFLLIVAGIFLSPQAAVAEPAPADTATARILAEADSIRARQAREAEILARADSIRAVPHPDSLAFKQLQYDSQKKSVAVGVGLGFLLPGLGNFYADDLTGGIFLLALGITGVALASSESEGSGGHTVGQGIVLITFIASPIGGAQSVLDHNEKLKRKLGVVVAETPSGRPALALAEHF